MKKHLLLLSLAASAVLADTFTLGQVNVLELPINESPFEQTMTEQEIAQQNSENLATLLDNISGLNMQLSGGGRNESMISIRGQDTKRIGVFIDGIPVYVPYDGNFDLGRFLTTDISQIDVSKGYSSVAFGGNTLGGVINIVTKRPTKPLEGEVKTGFVLDSDGAYSRSTTSLNVGSKQDHFYVQLGANYSDQDHYTLSNDFTPITNGIQKEGERLRSATNDRKINIKTGYVADDGSEIAIGYSNQKGEKQVPPSTLITSLSARDKWTWPYWNKETFSLSGQKNFGNSYLKGTAYYDNSRNSLDYNYMLVNNGGFPNGASRYDDYSYGGRLEYGIELSNHMVTASANYKKDVHHGYQINELAQTEILTDHFEDHSYALGLEDVYTISPNWQVLAGVGYDKKEGDKGWDLTGGTFPVGAQDAISPEAALIFSPDATSKIRASIAQKTYLPSMKDRYTRTLSTPPKEPNPSLGAETATHYELSYQKKTGPLSSKIAGFYSRVEDAIQSMQTQGLGTPTTNDDVYQNQNVGIAIRKGGEIDLTYATDGLEVGGNYSYILYENETQKTIKMTDIPKHQAFIYGQKEITDQLSLYGSMKYRQNALEQISGVYKSLPMFATFDVKATYKATNNITAEAGIKNATDRLVVYNNGYPIAGREFFANFSYKF